MSVVRMQPWLKHDKYALRLSKDSAVEEDISADSLHQFKRGGLFDGLGVRPIRVKVVKKQGRLF